MPSKPCPSGCTCRKHREWRHTPETRAKISAAHKAFAAEKSVAMMGANNPMYGRTHSPEARAKMAEANAGGTSYMAAHRLVRRLRGEASEHICAHCGGRSDEWSYSGGDAAELIDVRPDRNTRARYSLDPDFYTPLCRSCHRRYDCGKRRAA